MVPAARHRHGDGSRRTGLRPLLLLSSLFSSPYTFNFDSFRICIHENAFRKQQRPRCEVQEGATGDPRGPVRSPCSPTALMGISTYSWHI